MSDKTDPWWHPIETAPLDQRIVLIWCPKEYQGNGGMHVAAHMNFSDRPGWYSHISAIHEPTMWMPLPPRPDRENPYAGLVEAARIALLTGLLDEAPAIVRRLETALAKVRGDG